MKRMQQSAAQPAKLCVLSGSTPLPKAGENVVYMVRCADDSLYTGWTNDLQARTAAHNEGRGAKYTKARLPVALVYYEVLPDKRAALRREWELKHLSRQKKLALLKSRSKSFI